MYMHILTFISKNGKRIFSAFVLIIIFLFLLSYFDLHYILSNTTPTGGDTPAHNYLAKHLKETFFTRGTVISWAKGWWCGFPMYQYYFFFPYLLMSILSFIIPMNIAFKIVSILGVVFLPLGVYFSFKWMNFDKTISLISSIAMIPFLFVNTHTMWGVNIYSTLAGEISNSVSFIFFVLFLGSFYNDMERIRFRLRTVALFTLLFYSHFFTSVIAGLASFFLLFIFGKNNFKQRFIVYMKLNVLTFLLIAWWFIPILAKNSYSLEYGGDWDVTLWKTFPSYTIALIPFVLFAAIYGILKKRKNLIFTFLLLPLSIIAFYTGGKINASFPNIRFWPFIFYALMIMASVGFGYMIERLRAKEILVTALFILVIMLTANSPNDVRAWVKWNNEGLEKKSDYATFRDLVLPLDNTPGRLANDLHGYNNHFGSTRVFETVPYLINKDILEGGIVNSASGSMFSYYIQCATSQSCAGFPTVVNPTTFNMEKGTKYLKLANVKHFIAYWDKTRKALLNNPEWKLLKSVGQYQLFELKSNDGSYVYIPENKPLTVRTKHWKESNMEWIYTINALDTPFILLYNSQKVSTSESPAIFSEDEYLGFLSNLSNENDEIPLWLTLGPFYFTSGIPDEKAIEIDPVDISSLNPESGHEQFGRIWKPILRYGPIFLDGLYKPSFNFINYNCTTIYSEIEQKALLHYSNDDQARIYLNGELIVATPFTGIYNYKTKKILLRKGNNSLIYKVEQTGGGVFFHTKLTDLNGKPLSSVRYSIASTIPNVTTEKTISLSAAIKELEISDQRIRFRTKALHQPHIIKFSYFPNWKVRGAKQIFHVTPNFMLVYPEQEEVTLYYGTLFSDIAGQTLTFIGGIIFAGAVFSQMMKRKKHYENQNT
ncbi:MAG: hypothetical protein A3C43_00785 [Candidatus Schekmanbacteria bacterium RIFCSPHIGHO2_02_FULL_38_11]|uniref:Membrane protein 6-pyruvoyl-tetrahydropterin synthase-related domain-containing protein n=1 Tax=Candidatus Schekmanbacteria bacterium RIFCSPLOWO2_12_FULL_38_15 TaxID=1817883 RepID=A0A1F7SMX0_9BACT|nr:MAG: hypothetical protein A2043_07830 [Candidatus Schekmanbacteria bacterium GWA2_38_9]OGL50009.1 MAG: hypothetical protein A3C43_00785 [Candidatus Schekmanbacteria bacterium RIFCSPHIGHO2_02_FULL_38_11]OGL51123.1 MAG: hypothetical protein A3H37_08860 [Candidatus Schekmanbacteria bacterium RIFCSPLOWO2_02_FULL_38_14]OGL55123.1 MAG: hypothetical protein A3G31_02685 [Candidatus Schekmanbacteria bacterium RIFCSPLOWO2_12_FULL_38_15]